MDVRISPAVPGDAVHLPEIEKSAAAAFRSIPDLAYLAEGAVMSVAEHEALIAKGNVWIAKSAEGTSMGFLSSERFGSVLHIHELSVHASFQGGGIGRQLIETAQSWATEKQLSGITLTTFSDVPWNAPFYERLGFQRLDTSELSPRLAAILREEAHHGLPQDQRCAMRWTASK